MPMLDLRKIALDAISAKLPSDGAVWFVAVFDVWRTRRRTTGCLWWKRTHVERYLEHDMECYGRHCVAYRREEYRLVFGSIPSITVDFDGYIKGWNVYATKDSTEPLLFCDFHGNTAGVTPGTTITVSGSPTLEIAQCST